MASERSNRIVRREVVALPPGRSVAYPGAPPDVRLPQVPVVEVPRDGFWGGENRAARDHLRRLVKLHDLAEEVDYALAAATAVEVSAIKVARDGMSKAERIVYATPADSVAGMLAADLASDMTARVRIRTSRQMEVLDNESMTILQRR